MTHRVGFLLVLVALGFAGCGEDDDREDPDPDTASASTATCPDGEDRRTTVYDLDASAVGESTPSEAVEVFLRQEGGDANLEDFELVEENEKRATYEYSEGDFKLVRLYVDQLERGWFVISFEYCQGAI